MHLSQLLKKFAKPWNRFNHIWRQLTKYSYSLKSNTFFYETFILSKKWLYDSIDGRLQSILHPKIAKILVQYFISLSDIYSQLFGSVVIKKYLILNWMMYCSHLVEEKNFVGEENLLYSAKDFYIWSTPNNFYSWKRREISTFYKIKHFKS